MLLCAKDNKIYQNIIVICSFIYHLFFLTVEPIDRGSNQNLNTDRELMIQEALSKELRPTVLEVINDSARHAGHAGHAEAGGGNQTHFKINIESERFTGMKQVDRQRMVYDLLADVFKDGVHSVTMTTKAPS